MSFEYKVVPAPTKGVKAKGVKSADDRFANALESTMNELALAGWEYQRTDTLPCEEREGLMGKTTVFKNMLVFRRALPDQADAAPTPAEDRVAETLEAPVQPPLLAKPTTDAPANEPHVAKPADNPVAAE